MAATFIPVSLSDFKPFLDKGFTLESPEGEESYLTFKVAERHGGELEVKVLTTIKSGSSSGRDVGKDAIRVMMVWHDRDGWSGQVGKKMSRVYRSGGEGATAADVVNRALERARGVYKSAMPACPKCGRPMVLRGGTNGPFWGCVGYSKSRANCRGSMNLRPQDED